MRGADQARQDYLAELVAWLWPGHALFPADQVGGGRRAYVALPSSSRPTILVPSGPRPVAATVLRSFKPSAPYRTRALLVAGSYGVRAGALNLSSSRLQLRRVTTPAPEDIEEHLRRVLGREVVVAPYTSPPRANRKPVLHVLTPQGRTVGFAKVAWNDLTDRLVRAEAHALDRLARADLGRVSMPELIDLGLYRDHPVLVQSAVTGTPWRRPRRPELVTAMKELAAVAGQQEEDLATGTFVRALHSRLEAERGEPSGRRLSELLDQLREAAGGRSVAVGAWHGDWAPWNMATTARGVALWDWERFSHGVPLGFDALHYRLQSDLVPRHQQPELAARRLLRDAPSTLDEFGVEGSSALLVALLYLLEIGTRLVEDRQAEAGGRRGRVEEWLLPAIADGLDTVQAHRTSG